jgi:hypothetical protein
MKPQETCTQKEYFNFPSECMSLVVLAYVIDSSSIPLRCRLKHLKIYTTDKTFKNVYTQRGISNQELVPLSWSFTRNRGISITAPSLSLMTASKLTLKCATYILFYASQKNSPTIIGYNVRKFIHMHGVFTPRCKIYHSDYGIY